MKTSNVRSFRALGLLAVPLLAVAIAVLALTWGHSTSQTTEATAGTTDMSLNVKAGGSCDDPAKPTECNVSAGGQFTLSVSVNGWPAGGYIGIQTEVDYDGLTYKKAASAADEIVWPDKALNLRSQEAPPATVVNHADATAATPPFPPSTYKGNIVELQMNCPTTPGVHVVNLVGLDAANTNGTGLKDTNNVNFAASDSLTINCTPPDEQINVTVANADDPADLLSDSCWLVSAEVTIVSPPQVINKPADVVSDNNAKAACDDLGPFKMDLSDKDPTVGSVRITISGKDRLAYGDIWHVQQVQANSKYDIDATKYECDLSLGKCDIAVTNTQTNGDLTVNFIEDPAGIPLLSVDGTDLCVNVSDAAGPVASDCALAGSSSVVFPALPVGNYTADFKGCPGVLIDVDPTSINVDVGAPGAKQPKIEFHCLQVLMNLKDPALSNLFLTAQGAKLPPDSGNCEDSTDVAVFTHSLNQNPREADPKDPTATQQVGGFEMEVWFDAQWVCVNIDPGQYAVDNNMVCVIDDKNDGLQPQGLARIGCNILGKPTIVQNSLELAVISVRPQPELYSQITANQDNGVVVQLLNKGCNLADVQGHPIAKTGCPDSALTIRYLEGDVNGDCRVNALDEQRLSFRWGAQVGSLLYNERYDLQPSGIGGGGGRLGPDGDVDIKDVQFVFGRHGSECGPQNSAGTAGPMWPPQEPVNPKS